MKLGLIVDGVSERDALPELRDQLSDRLGITMLKPLAPGIQPLAPFGTIARSCRASISILVQRQVDAIGILIDREGRQNCPGEISSAIAGQLGGTPVPLFVVVKDRMFENWLIADPDALASQPAAFEVTGAMRRRVEPNKADRVDAVREISRAKRGDYGKVADSCKVLARADIDRMARNSRSFRRLLRLMGHPSYADQSRRPV